MASPIASCGPTGRKRAFPENFQILDADDQQRLIKRILRSLDLDEKRWPPRQVAWFINGQKDEGRRARHVEPGGDHFTETLLKVYEAYETLCFQGGLVDFMPAPFA